MVWSLMTLRVFSQSDCDKLLQYGIFNEVRKSSKTNNYKEEQHNSCNQLDESIKKSEGGSAGVSFLGFGLNGNYSHEELINIKKLYCESGSIKESEDQVHQYYSHIVAPEVLDAFLKCKQATANQSVGIKVSSTDEDFHQIHISLTGRYPNVALAPSLKQMDIDTSVFKILNRDLYDSSAKGAKLDKAYNLLLERKVLNVNQGILVEDENGRKKVLSRQSLIGINLNDQSLVLIIPEIQIHEEAVYLQSPLLGQIITSVLDSITFMKKFNNYGEWMLANGDQVPTSARDYRSLYGNSVPDLRGVFVRGRNYSRNDAYANPGGDFTNGYQQQDLLKSHWHEFNYGPAIAVGTGPHPDRNLTLPISSTPPTNTTELNATMSTGGTETCPKNVTLSYYVRIRVRDINQ